MGNQLERVKITNEDNANDIIIVHECEGWEYRLPPNEEIFIEIKSDIVKNGYTNLGVSSYEGNICIRILENYSYYRVLKDGVDVFEKYYD